MPLGKFVRSILGLDVQVAQAAFADFIQSGAFTADQMPFIDTIISYLTKKPPPGFADRREAIPTRGMGELAHTKGRGNPRHAGKRNVWLQALWGVWQELWKIHGGR